MAQPPDDISPPVKPEESPQKTSWLVRIGISLVVLLCGFAGLVLLMGYLFGQERARGAKRSASVRILAEAVTLYEQSYRIAMTELPDWQKALVDSGFIKPEMFEHREAASERINYILLSRPTAQFKARQPLWLVIYEDPRTLANPDLNVHARFHDTAHGSAWSKSELSKRVQDKCLEFGVPCDPQSVGLVDSAATKK